MSLLSQIFSCDLASSPASSSLAHSNAERSPPANANNRAKSAGFEVIRGVLTRNSRILGLFNSLDFTVLFSMT